VSRHDSPLRHRMIFLVGARRSGTNWLQRTLASHPDLAYLPSETYLFSHAISPLADRFQHSNPGSPMMARTYIRRDSFLDAVRDLVDAAFLDTIEHVKPSARYYIERTPWHASHLDLIRDVFPDARVLHIIRDGRAVARSLFSMDWGPNTLREAAEEWRDTVVAGRTGRANFGSRYHEVFYERLLADPRVELGRLLSWLELETAEDTWTQMLLEAGSEFNVDPRSPGVRDDKWRHTLSPREIREFEQIAGGELEALGYARAAADLKSDKLRDPILRMTTGIRRAGRLARAAGRPRAAARAAATRAYERRSRRESHKKHEVVEQFERMLAHGSLDVARSILAADVRVRIHDGSETFRGRGEDATAKLMATLDKHRILGLQAATGELHGSPGTFTSVLTYDLENTSRWTRTLVFYVTYPKITEIIMYRFPLSPDLLDSAPTDPAFVSASAR
jgi:Sulfotransferase family